MRRLRRPQNLRGHVHPRDLREHGPLGQRSAKQKPRARTCAHGREERPVAGGVVMLCAGWLWSCYYMVVLKWDWNLSKVVRQ